MDYTWIVDRFLDSPKGAFYRDKHSIANVEVKYIWNDQHTRCYPVVHNSARANRHFQEYSANPKTDCWLCSPVPQPGREPQDGIVPGFLWHLNRFPIKPGHGIVFPPNHRSMFFKEDIVNMFNFLESTENCVISVNGLGSAASIPEHFHGQTHSMLMPAQSTDGFSLSNFPMLIYSQFKNITTLHLFQIERIESYPAFVVRITSNSIEALAVLAFYFPISTCCHPWNFILLPKQLYIIPRDKERPPLMENRWGASEIMGLCSPVTKASYEEITQINQIEDALRASTLQDRLKQEAFEEHIVFVAKYIEEKLAYHQSSSKG